MPAHATIWGYAYPNLTISCPEAQTLLDPTGDIYTVIENLFEEFIPLFKEDFIHIGGDEVHSMECWAQSPKVHALSLSPSTCLPLSQLITFLLFAVRCLP